MADEKKDQATEATAVAGEPAAAKPAAAKKSAKPAAAKAASAKSTAAQPTTTASGETKPAKPAKAAATKPTKPAAAESAKPASSKSAKPATETATETAVPAKSAASSKSAKPAKPAAAKPAAKTLAEAATERPRILKVHHLRPALGAKQDRVRKGRGEASKGKTSGRGTKGTKARHNVPARLEGGQMPLHMRLPKLRGFKNRFRVEYEVVNVGRIAELFPDGGSVTKADLVAKGAVRAKRLVKVLGEGDINVKIAVTVDAWSAAAESKITAAGGQIGS